MGLSQLVYDLIHPMYMTSQAGPGPKPAGQSNKDHIVYMMDSSDNEDLSDNDEDSNANDSNPPTPNGESCDAEDITRVKDSLRNLHRDIGGVRIELIGGNDVNESTIENIKRDCEIIQSSQSLDNLENKGRGSIRDGLDEVKENLTKIEDGTAQTKKEKITELDNSLLTLESEIKLLSNSSSRNR